MILKKGSKGNEVKLIQEFLGIENDGIFGPGTERAVKNWQRENKENSVSKRRKNIRRLYLPMIENRLRRLKFINHCMNDIFIISKKRHWILS